MRHFSKVCFLLTVLIGGVLASATAGAETVGTASRWVGGLDAPDGRFQWSGSGPVFHFDGTELSVTLEDGGDNSLIAEVDGTAARLDLREGQHAYAIAEGLAPGRHEVRLLRRTERFFGPTRLVSAQTDGQFRAAPPPARRMLVVGDSISAGYGIEGADKSCRFSASTENQYLTYAAIAARRVGAEVLTMAVSGKGAARNFNGSTDGTMPDLIEPAPADVIVVHLGTNDFSGGHRPADFVERYAALLHRLRVQSPDAALYAALGPMLAADDRAAATEAIAKAVALREAEGETRLRFVNFPRIAGEYGCNWHPNLRAHAQMADILAQTLIDDLGWQL